MYADTHNKVSEYTLCAKFAYSRLIVAFRSAILSNYVYGIHKPESNCNLIMTHGHNSVGKFIVVSYINTSIGDASERGEKGYTCQYVSSKIGCTNGDAHPKLGNYRE